MKELKRETKLRKSNFAIEPRGGHLIVQILFGIRGMNSIDLVGNLNYFQHIIYNKWELSFEQKIFQT